MAEKKVREKEDWKGIFLSFRSSLYDLKEGVEDLWVGCDGTCYGEMWHSHLQEMGLSDGCGGINQVKPTCRNCFSLDPFLYFTIGIQAFVHISVDLRVFAGRAHSPQVPDVPPPPPESFGGGKSCRYSQPGPPRPPPPS